MNEDDLKKEIPKESPIGGVEFLDTTEAEIEKELQAEKSDTIVEIPKTDTVGGIEFDTIVTPEKQPTIESKIPDKNEPFVQKSNTEHSSNELHTYSEDIARAVKTGGGKILRQALTETDDRVVNIQKKNNQQLILSIATIMLFVAGIGIVLYFAQPKEAPIYIESQTNIPASFISAENSYQVDVTDKGRLNVIGDVVAMYESQININTIANIYFIQQTPLGKSKLTTNDFFALLQTTIPANLLASLDSQFMFGTYVGDETTPFLIIKSNSFESLSSGLRLWESGILTSFYQLFQIDRDTSGNVFEKKFEDIVVANKDGRVVYDNEENPVFMYVFINENTVVLTKNVTTASEVIRRYLSPIF